MFTVNHVKNGVDTFHSARTVAYHGPHAPMGSTEGYSLELVGGDSSEVRLLSGGKAYVMNEQGATVGSYILDFAVEAPVGGALVGLAGAAATGRRAT